MSLTDISRPRVAASGTKFEEADIAVAEHLGRFRDTPALKAVGALTQIGDQGPLLALSGAVLVFGLLSRNDDLAGAGARMVAATLAATAMKNVLKRIISRTRPELLLEEGRYEVCLFGPDEGPCQSFPSGHTAGSVAVARALGRVYPGAEPPALGAAAAIGLALIPIGRHYPSDVVAGMLVGLAAEAASERAILAAAAWLSSDTDDRPDAQSAGRPRLEPDLPSSPLGPPGMVLTAEPDMLDDVPPLREGSPWRAPSASPSSAQA